jgi:hypothetical protein
VYVGAHATREAILVTGNVPNDAAIRDLQTIIDAHPSGIEVIWKIAIGKPR